jgi:hypothetical protein
VRVPKRMWTRVSEGVIYFFEYDYSNQEIRFDSKILQTEVSDFSEREINENDFRIKTKILKGILF